MNIEPFFLACINLITLLGKLFSPIFFNSQQQQQKHQNLNFRIFNTEEEERRKKKAE